ncbi:MAG: bifunctional transaldolase/phosoglucose isomerase [Acidobacteriota bacterium]
MFQLGTFSISLEQRAAVGQVLDEWRNSDNVSRLWNRDASLWTSTTEAQWLGWLDIVQSQLRDIGRFPAFAAEVRRRDFSDIVLLGMGGSSLCPEVLSKSFGRIKGAPAFHVLDSTDPAQVLTLERRINIAKSLFIVSSKSGSTLEPNIFKQYFFERARREGSQFVAITDPGSKMEEVAKRDGFLQIFHGVPSIGGRYSALSDFGMIPAAAMGIDVFQLLDGARTMVEACSPWQPVDQNPGVVLGAYLGALGRAGHDKVSIVCSPGIRDFGAWMEQLIAESTGKEGKGLIPVDREPLATPSQYGLDRVFVYMRLDTGFDPAQDRAIASLEAVGQPVVRIPVANAYQLGAEFFRWEMATAVAGSVLGINPFDQPDVEAAKIEAKKLTTAFEQTGSLPKQIPAFEEDGIRVYGDTDDKRLVDVFRNHFKGLSAGDFLMGRFRPGNYIGLLAFIEMNERHEGILQSLRERLRDATRAATCLQFGPRFLHSTGQAYKGGPPTGVFLQITADDVQDVPIPGQKFTFGIVKAAQAQGDLEVLKARGRKTLRVHLTGDIAMGLSKLASAINLALK